MTDNIKIEIGKTYQPKKKVSSENEIIGDSWRAWRKNEHYFYECDVGHFSSKFKKIEISGEDFLLLKAGKISGQSLRIKYELTAD